MLTRDLEVLKQPLHTTITIDALEFGEFAVEEKLHIVISVKDFKSIIAHAGTTNTTVKALYSRPSNPMQLTYTDEGLLCEFILMTTGEARGNSVTPAPRANTARDASRQLPQGSSNSKGARNRSEMAPPLIEAAPSATREAKRVKVSRPSPPPPQPSIQSQALFCPEADDERRWEPVNYEDEDDEALMWDGSGTGLVCEPLETGNY